MSRRRVVIPVRDSTKSDILTTKSSDSFAAQQKKNKKNIRYSETRMSPSLSKKNWCTKVEVISSLSKNIVDLSLIVGVVIMFSQYLNFWLWVLK